MMMTTILTDSASQTTLDNEINELSSVIAKSLALNENGAVEDDEKIEVSKADNASASTSPTTTAAPQQQFGGYNTKFTYFVDGRNYRKICSFYKAGGILFYRRVEGKMQLLLGLEHRTDTSTLHIHPIGGKLDSGEMIIGTCTREFYEETGEIARYAYVKSLIYPPRHGTAEANFTHAPKCLYYGGGKYCLYIAPCPLDLLSIDISYNSTPDEELKSTAELTGLMWVDWDLFESTFVTLIDNPLADGEVYSVEETLRQEFVRHTLLESRDSCKGDAIVLGKFVLELLGNTLMLEELRKRNQAFDLEDRMIQ